MQIENKGGWHGKNGYLAVLILTLVAITVACLCMCAQGCAYSGTDQVDAKVTTPGLDDASTTLTSTLTYAYVNLPGGIEIGSPDEFRFFIHSGPSWVLESTRARALPAWAKRQNVFDGTSTTLGSMSGVKAQAGILPTIKIGVRGMIY
jgi:hypothetical protein